MLEVRSRLTPESLRQHGRPWRESSALDMCSRALPLMEIRARAIRGLLKRCPVTASGVRLIGKETERGWEQDDDISTLLPSLLQYEFNSVVGERLRQRLLQIPLDVLKNTTGLSRHTILRARRKKRVHPRSLRALSDAIVTIDWRMEQKSEGNLLEGTNLEHQVSGSGTPWTPPCPKENRC